MTENDPATTDGQSGSTATDFSPTYGQGDEVTIQLRDSGMQVRGAIVAESSTGVTIRKTVTVEEWRQGVEDDGREVDVLTFVRETWEQTFPWTSIQWVEQLVDRGEVGG